VIFEIEGICYHVEKIGDGFPLIALHGFTGDSSTWHSFIERWTQHSSLILLDIIGHGKTDAPDQPERYQMKESVNAIYQLLQRLNINKADFLGYSMGGRLALSFAVSHPEMVRRLILESASPGLKTEAERKERRIKDQQLASFIRDQGIDSFVDYWEGIPLFASQRNLPLDLQTQIREQRLTISEIGLSNSLIGMGTGAQVSNWDRIEQLSNPVLLITGELDKKFCDIACEMKKELKNCQLIVIDSAGHAIHVEQKEKFGTIVSEFVQSE
jgi:2-succinyl-6-hydroxy-2,4-cyclohexadiene-1-carboxylate synthase